MHMRHAKATPTAAPAVEPPAVEPPPAEPETHDHMMELPGGPVLHFRGFFDFDFDKALSLNSCNIRCPSPAPVPFGPASSTCS